jgi:hypothetical protein
MMKMNLKNRALVLLIVCVAGLAFLSSCKESGVSSSNQNASVSLKTLNSGSQDNSVIIIESAKVLLERVQLQSSSESITVNQGPYVVYINLLGTLNEIALAPLPPGTYDRSISRSINTTRTNLFLILISGQKALVFRLLLRVHITVRALFINLPKLQFSILE